MKTLWTRLLAVLAVLALTVIVGIAALTRYYQNSFGVNTWINGIYATGKTFPDMKTSLLKQSEIPESIEIVAYDRVGQNAGSKSYILPLDEIGFSFDYDPALRNCYAEQKKISFFERMKTPLVYDLQPERQFNEELLLQWWQKHMPDMQAEADYRVVYSDESGYEIYDTTSHRLNEDMALQLVRNALTTGESSSVDLISAECYYNEPLTGAQKEQKQLWTKLKLYQSNGPVYDFDDEKRELTHAEMASFLQKDAATQMPLIDEYGAFLIDEDKLAEWLKNLADVYDTYDREWSFEATSGKTVIIQGGTYGTTMDQKKELAWLKQYFHSLSALRTMDGVLLSEESAPGRLRTAEYSRDAFTHSGTTIGDTYIEVDMGLQKLYYYEDGELKLETDTVTGNMRRKYDTPEGLNFVYNKQKNRILRGQGYTSRVKFWLPVKGAVGIHDATWRDEFGGDIYLTNGSHGCINIPVEKAEELYDMVEIGTPVVMFYGLDNN